MSHDAVPEVKGPRVIRFICGWYDCARKGEEQEGDNESVYFATLCDTCQRPLYKTVGGSHDAR